MHTTRYTSKRSVLRELRHAAGMTQVDLAIASGVSIGHEQKLEAGLLPKRRNSPAVTAICDALGITEAQLRGEESHP